MAPRVIARHHAVPSRAAGSLPRIQAAPRPAMSRPGIGCRQRPARRRPPAPGLPAAQAGGDAEPAEPAAAAPEAPSSADAAVAAPAGPDAVAPALPRWRALLAAAWAAVQAHLWPLLALHVTCDGLILLLHRVSHRLTNEVALQLCGGAVTPEAIGNLWWLSTNPEVANWQTGYQLVTALGFLLAFPLSVLIKAWAALLTIYICRDQAGRADAVQPWWRPLAGLRAAVPVLRRLAADASPLWRPAYLVELLVSAAVLPLQFASLAVVTLPLTLPLILELQAALPAAVLEGERGLAAIRRSRALVKPMRWQLAVPFVGLVVVQRLVEAGKGALLTAMPPRYYRELVELPLAVMLAGLAASLLLARLSDVLSYVSYTQARELEQQGQQQPQAGGGGA